MTRPISQTATDALNKVLLQAATRAERIKAEKQAEQLARDVARLCDELAKEP